MTIKEFGNKPPERTGSALSAIDLALIAGIMCMAATKLFTTPVVPIPYYPFTMGSDTWQWLSQALHYLGEPTPDYYRPPLLSFVFMVMHTLGLLNYAGFAVQAFSLLAAFSLYLVTNKLYGRRTALLSVFLLLINKHFFVFSHYLNPDILCVSLVMFSLYCFLRNDTFSSLAGWLLLGLSFYAHNFLPAFPMIAGALFLLRGRTVPQEKIHRIGFGLYALLILIYFLTFYDTGASHGRHVQFLKFTSFKNLWTYTVWTCYVLSLTGTVWVAAGIFRSFRCNEKKELFLLACLVLPPLIFFGLFYDYWVWGRFIIYWSFPLIILMARGFDGALRLVKSRIIAALLLVITIYYSLSSAVYGKVVDGMMEIASIDGQTAVLFPGTVIYDDGTVKREETSSSLAFLLTNDRASIQRSTGRTILPSETERIARFLNAAIPPEACFSIVPLNYRARTNLVPPIEFLSRRKYSQLSDDTMNDTSLKAIVFFDPPAMTDLELLSRGLDYDYTLINYSIHPSQIALAKKVRDHVSRNSRFRLAGATGLFSVYIRAD